MMCLKQRIMHTKFPHLEAIYMLEKVFFCVCLSVVHHKEAVADLHRFGLLLLQP